MQAKDRERRLMSIRRTMRDHISTDGSPQAPRSSLEGRYYLVRGACLLLGDYEPNLQGNSWFPSGPSLGGDTETLGWLQTTSLSSAATLKSP